jgi:hypothetical protein
MNIAAECARLIKNGIRTPRDWAVAMELGRVYGERLKALEDSDLSHLVAAGDVEIMVEGKRVRFDSNDELHGFLAGVMNRKDNRR